MSSERDLKVKVESTLLTPRDIKEWQASENSHKSVRRLSLVRGVDSYEWHADQVLAITRHLSADRGGILESLEIAEFIPDTGSTGEDPPPIGEVLRPVAHSLTSIWLDVPNEIGSGILLGVLYTLPRLREFTIYAPAIRKSQYQGEITKGCPSMTGKLGLFHLDMGGDHFVRQLLRHQPLEYHTMGLSHNKLIDSYNSLISTCGKTLRSLAIRDVGKYIQIATKGGTLNREPCIEERHFKQVHDHISVADCPELSELVFDAGRISESKTTRMIAAVLSTVSSVSFGRLRISYQIVLDSDTVTAEVDSPEWDAVDEELVRIAGESDCQIEVIFNSLSPGGGAPVQAPRFLSRFQEEGTVKFTSELGLP